MTASAFSSLNTTTFVVEITEPLWTSGQLGPKLHFNLLSLAN